MEVRVDPPMTSTVRISVSNAHIYIVIYVVMLSAYVNPKICDAVIYSCLSIPLEIYKNN